MRKTIAMLVGVAGLWAGVGLVGVGSATPAAHATIDPGVQYNTCRENSIGRVAAIKHINDYYQTWDQPQADVIVADVNNFIAVCTGYAGAGAVIKAGKVVKACFAEWAEWAGWLPYQTACYAYWDTSGGGTGNTLPKYHSALLVSSR